jgi:hypothetical protein
MLKNDLVKYKPLNEIIFMKTKDRQHTTNYLDTFIEVAEDCKLLEGKIPVLNPDKKTIAAMQFELIAKNPYKFTSDDILFMVFAERNDITESEYKQARAEFFSKGQACLRASPLTKQFGWGIHCNEEGKIALYNLNSDEYQSYLQKATIQKVKAMRSSKK